MTIRATTRATVGREESPSASSPQRPVCSRRIPYIPAAVPALRLRLMFSAGPILPPLHMPAEITTRGKVDISRVAILFGHIRAVSATADNTLTIKQKSTLPVSKTRQDKSLFHSLSDTYLPPAAQSRSHQPPIAQLSVAPALLPPPRAAPALR